MSKKLIETVYGKRSKFEIYEVPKPFGGKEFIIHENESTYIPLGKTHRLENPGKLPLHLIEVQSGSYLGEDDIVRFEDTYGRA